MKKPQKTAGFLAQCQKQPENFRKILGKPVQSEC